MSNRIDILDKSNILKRLELPIFIVGMFLCTFLTNTKTCDYTLTTRNLIWLAMTICLFVLVMIRAMRGEKVFSDTLIFPLFIGFIIVSILSMTRSIVLGESVYEVLRLCALLILMFVIMNMPDRDEFIKIMVVSSLCLAVYGAYVVFTDPFKKGTMANKNMFASAILLLIPFALMGWKYRKWKVFCAISIVLSVCCIFALGTRSVILALVVFVVALTIRSRRTFIQAMLCFVIIGCIIFVLNTNKVNSIFRTYSMLERKNLWLLTAKMGYDNPLGVGTGNWPVRIPHYNRLIDPEVRKEAFVKRYYRRAHNDFAQTFSETGYLGLALYLSLFGSTLWYSRNNRILFAWTLAYMTFATFSFPEERPFHSIILMCIFALAAHGKRFALKKRYIIPISAITLMILSVTAYDFHIRHETEKTLNKMYKCWKVKDWASSAKLTKNYSWLSSLNFSGDPIAYYYGVACLQIGDKPNMPLCFYSNTERAFDAFKEALTVNPYHAYSMINLGACCDKKNMLTESIACYQMASYIYPDYGKAKDGLAYVTYKKERNKI